MKGRGPGPGRGKKRLTEPLGFNPYHAGGAGIIARRNVDPTLLFDGDKLERMAVTNPLRLVRELPSLHPSVDMALNTAKRLTCPVDGIQIVADDVNPDGSSGDINAKDTAAIDALWDDQPSETGGSLRGLQTILTSHAILSGMAAVEVVPGPPLTGIKRIWPIDTLTTQLYRPSREADLILRQYQRWPLSTASKFDYGWQELPLDRVKWRSLDPEVDDPHGRAPYASATNEILADLALIQDLRDAVHNAAWPRIQVGVNLSELHKVAVEVYHLNTFKAASEWVTERFNTVVDYVSNLRPDDNVVNDSSGQVNNLQPGGFDGVEGVLSFLRQRIAQSLKTLPTLLGINDGSTFNYTSVEWAIYAQGLETMRSIIAEILVDVANQHLRLTGSTSRARVILTEIRTNDAQISANTESTNITNATNLEKLGYLTHDEAAVKVTGKKARGPAQPGVVEPMPIAAAPPSGVTGTRKQGRPGPKNLPANPNSGGTTREERDTKKQTQKAA